MIQNNLRKEIEEYLISHPLDRNTPNPYDEAALAFNVEKELIRSIWRSLRRKGLVEQNDASVKPSSNKAIKTIVSGKVEETFTRNGDTAVISKTVPNEVKNEKDLILACKIDTVQWRITDWECKRYNAWIKNKEGEIEAQPQYSVYAKLKERKLDTDLGKQKDTILKELFAVAPDLRVVKAVDRDAFEHLPEKDCLFEISIPDVHFGKLAWKEESGEDYDLAISCKRYTAAIDDLLSRINLAHVERILFPIGNDMINIDGNNNMTTAGTPQQVDSRFPKIIKVVKNLLIKTINRLSEIAPVDVLVVPGNHDNQTMFLLGEIIDAYYFSSQSVSVQNSPNPRKYYEYGSNGFLYCHGDQEKHADLGLIFATEQPKLWAGLNLGYAN